MLQSYSGIRVNHLCHDIRQRIPYHKRGNKLYFFEDEVIAWIKQGGTSGVASESEIERRLEELRNGKKRKPGALTDGNSRMSAVAP